MTYLLLYSDDDWCTYDVPLSGASDVYILPLEAESLYGQWDKIPYYADGLLSGVIADWLEENAHTLQVERQNDNLLRGHIDYMRRRFASPQYNRSHL